MSLLKYKEIFSFTKITLHKNVDKVYFFVREMRFRKCSEFHHIVRRQDNERVKNFQENSS